MRYLLLVMVLASCATARPVETVEAVPDTAQTINDRLEARRKRIAIETPAKPKTAAPQPDCQINTEKGKRAQILNGLDCLIKQSK